MGEFNSDDHYIYYCGQESLNRQWVMKILNILSCVSFVSCLAQILCLTCKFSNCWHKFVHVHVHAYSVMSDSFIDYDGYSISSKGFFPTVVDIMVI